MSRVWAIAHRELSSFFRLPLGWVSIALYLFLAGVVFSLWIVQPGQPASLRWFFAYSGWVLLPVAPAISMRLMSEELRTGTIEPLLTSPVGDAQIILGKFLGAASFLALMIAPTLVYVFLLFRIADPAPDVGPILAGYLSLLLLGGLYLSIGLLASTLTSNQTLAFLGTLFAILLLLMIPAIPVQSLPDWGRRAVFSLAITHRLTDFAKGVVDTSHLVFFVSASALVLLLAVLALQTRRWR